MMTDQRDALIERLRVENAELRDQVTHLLTRLMDHTDKEAADDDRD